MYFIMVILTVCVNFSELLASGKLHLEEDKPAIAAKLAPVPITPTADLSGDDADDERENGLSDCTYPVTPPAPSPSPEPDDQQSLLGVLALSHGSDQQSQLPLKSANPS